MIAAKDMMNEIKETLKELENIDLEELEPEPKTTNTQPEE